MHACILSYFYGVGGHCNYFHFTVFNLERYKRVKGNKIYYLIFVYFISATKYNVETRIIDVDFTKTDIYDRIEKELSNLDIGVLINNVGMSYDMPQYFSEISEK